MLIRGLERDGVAAVYAASADVQWQILFYGDERIPTRGRSNTDRYLRLDDPNVLELALLGFEPDPKEAGGS